MDSFLFWLCARSNSSSCCQKNERFFFRLHATADLLYISIPVLISSKSHRQKWSLNIYLHNKISSPWNKRMKNILLGFFSFTCLARKWGQERAILYIYIHLPFSSFLIEKRRKKRKGLKWWTLITRSEQKTIISNG